MRDLEIMNRMEKVEKKLKKLQYFKEEKEQLMNNCKHNVIVVTNEENCYSVEAKCLFCGRSFESNRKLYGHRVVVDISGYYCIFHDTDKMILEVKKIYQDIISQNENLEPNEISKLIKERFKGKYQKTKKNLENIERKVREKT